MENLNTAEFIRNAGLPPLSESDFSNLHPAEALRRLRSLNKPGITRERLRSIQQLRAHFTERLNKLN